MGIAKAELWGRVPGLAVCRRRAGDSCPEWRRRSRSRVRGQRLSDGPRWRPQLLTGEGAEPGLEGPGSGGFAKPGVLVSGGWDTEGPSALPPWGCGDSGSARCSMSTTLGGQPASEPREGQAGLHWVSWGGGVSEPALPASPGDITDHPPPPQPPPLSSPPLLAAPFVPAELSPRRPAHQRGRRLPVSDFIE